VRGLTRGGLLYKMHDIMNKLHKQFFRYAIRPHPISPHPRINFDIWMFNIVCFVCLLSVCYFCIFCY
jgi:hypothetical protein